MGTLRGVKAESGLPFRRVWIKAFWGFDPENEGFLGFTREGDRTRIFEDFEPGDLILIYGTKGRQTAKKDRGKTLGFLEVTPEPVNWRSRISETALRWKREQNALEKWNFAMPVQRAWRVTPGQANTDIETLAPITYEWSNVQNIATRGKLLKNSEARRALALEVAETTVFGSPNAPDFEAPIFVDPFRPSRGLIGVPGKRNFEIKDGPCKVYLMRWEGEARHLLADRHGDVSNLSIVKVGMSTDPARRCLGLNSSIPPASVARWVVVAESKFYSSINAAKAVEDRLKSEFDRKFTSLGGEYFLGALETVGKRFLSAVTHHAP
jgi:hypothetical protein